MSRWKIEELWQLVAGLAVLAVILVGGSALISESSAQAQSYPPECVTVNVGTSAAVLFCGDGGLADSPVRDSEAGDTWAIKGGGPLVSGSTVLDRDDPAGAQVCTVVSISQNSGNGPVLAGVRFCGSTFRPVWATEGGDTWVVDGGPWGPGAVVLDVDD